MLIAWVKSYTPAGGKPARVFTSITCCLTGPSSEGCAAAGERFVLRLGMKSRSSSRAKSTSLASKYKPLPFSFGAGAEEGVKPADLKLD
ncbi:MAG: hypothetical protein U0736_18540 [Gemmataceae bacterium]